MKNYRIKKVIRGNDIKYYPQKKLFGLFWMNIGSWYSDLDYANYIIKEDIINSNPPVIEYLEPELESKLEPYSDYE